MNLIPATSTPDCKTCLEAYLRLDPPTGRLLLHFISASVNQPINQQFFSQQSFLMEEDFALPKAISSKLGFTGHPIIIERGSYPVLKDDLFLTLSLRVGHINKSSHYAVRNVAEH